MKLLASLSRPQRIAVCVGMAAVFLTLLFPPGEWPGAYDRIEPRGRQFLFASEYTIAIAELLVQLAMIAAGTAAVVLALGIVAQMRGDRAAQSAARERDLAREQQVTREREAAGRARAAASEREKVATEALAKAARLHDETVRLRAEIDRLQRAICIREVAVRDREEALQRKHAPPERST